MTNTHENCCWYEKCPNNYRYNPNQCPEYMRDKKYDKKATDNTTDGRAGSSEMAGIQK